MFDKTIKLKGEYPSDFKPTMSVRDIQLFLMHIVLMMVE